MRRADIPDIYLRSAAEFRDGERYKFYIVGGGHSICDGCLVRYDNGKFLPEKKAYACYNRVECDGMASDFKGMMAGNRWFFVPENLMESVTGDPRVEGEL